ncbi:hypothetical protein EYF80_005195 [Liparis tanakae]|uniref:Uncharacterized protein n=1 Tax=Liparis tanakae TaxID=230148 RepID=A0A4Z2J2B6_9TELE|nr:hypothetical protein EYF80_005195 [Liparis tanakae]
MVSQMGDTIFFTSGESTGQKMAMASGCCPAVGGGGLDGPRLCDAPLHIGTMVSPLPNPERCNKDSPTKCRRCADETRRAGI